MLNSLFIKKTALEIGFSVCGIASYDVMSEHNKYLYSWLENSQNGSLSYMNRYCELREDPSLLLENTQSVIVCAVNYKFSPSLKQSTNKFASYSLCPDYHYTIKAMLNELKEKLEQEYGNFNSRPCVDSAPIFEKAWAVRAGLGSVGRNSLLITPEFGSYVLLGELLIDKAVDAYDSPLEWQPCKDCHRCIDACPRGAINDNKTLDARLCISALTTEPKAQVKDISELCGWVFGCDQCTKVCPYNATSPECSDPRFLPIVEFSKLDSDFWQSAQKSDFKRIFAKTPVFRTKFEVLAQRISFAPKKILTFRR